MKKSFLLSLSLLTLCAGLAQAECVFTYTATEKLETQFNNLGTPASHEFSNGEGMVTFNDNVTTIVASAFDKCTALQSITLPASVTTIGGDAFNTCYSLQSVDLSNVTTIGSGAFSGCMELQSITLSENLTTIESEAFSYCNSLTEVTVAWTEATKIPAIDANVFQGIAGDKDPSGATLHVPVGKKALYETANVWKTFGTIDDPFVLAQAKTAAIAEIDNAIAEVTDKNIKAIADKAKEDINAATTEADITSIKDKALADIANFILAKAAAVASYEIDMAAEAAKVEIDNASTYPAADAVKAEYKGKIDNTVANAETVLRRASTIAEVSEEQAKYTLTIKSIVTEAQHAIAPINALEEHRAQVIGDIENARQEVPLPELDEEQKAYLNETIDDAVNAVKAATIKTEMDRAEAKIFFILSMYPAGKAEAKAELLGSMGDECTNCTVVEVTDGTTTVTLYNATGVDYEVINQ